MASDQHQIISGLIVRRMKFQGYTEICSFDGMVRDGYFSEYNSPVTIGRHRPDCISFNPMTGKYILGEAKTLADLYSERTREELEDFTGCCLRYDEFDKVIFGIPSNAEAVALKIIQSLPAENKNKIELFKYYEAIDEESEFFS
jgi:hypothetical protein